MFNFFKRKREFEGYISPLISHKVEPMILYTPEEPGIEDILNDELGRRKNTILKPIEVINPFYDKKVIEKPREKVRKSEIFEDHILKLEFDLGYTFIANLNGYINKSGITADSLSKRHLKSMIPKIDGFDLFKVIMIENMSTVKMELYFAEIKEIDIVYSDNKEQFRYKHYYGKSTHEVEKMIQNVEEFLNE